MNRAEEALTEIFEIGKLSLRSARYLALISEEEYQQKLARTEELYKDLLGRIRDAQGLEGVRDEDRKTLRHGSESA